MPPSRRSDDRTDTRQNTWTTGQMDGDLKSTRASSTAGPAKSRGIHAAKSSPSRAFCCGQRSRRAEPKTADATLPFESTCAMDQPARLRGASAGWRAEPSRNSSPLSFPSAGRRDRRTCAASVCSPRRGKGEGSQQRAKSSLASSPRASARSAHRRSRVDGLSRRGPAKAGQAKSRCHSVPRSAPQAHHLARPLSPAACRRTCAQCELVT